MANFISAMAKMGDVICYASASKTGSALCVLDGYG